MRWRARDCRCCRAPTCCARVGEGEEAARAHRLPADAEGRGGRRRARHPPGAPARRVRPRLHHRAERGARGVPRRRPLRREVSGPRQARRGAGALRQLRQWRPPGRAQLLRRSAATRSCSKSRPAPACRERVRREMGERAVEAALAIGYRGVGTLEFLVDEDEQLLLHGDEYAAPGRAPRDRAGHGHRPRPGSSSGSPRASGWPSPARRSSAARPRHRVPHHRRRPRADFRPQTGVIEEYLPPSGPGVRVDSHLYRGYEVPPHYDSLLAKLIVWAPTREEAIARGQRALDEFVHRRRADDDSVPSEAAGESRRSCAARPTPTSWRSTARSSRCKR